MDSIFRRFVRHHPRVSVALVAGAAFALALALRRTMTAGPRAAPSAAHLLRLINAANARLSGKIFPMGQGAETVVVRDGGIAFVLTVLNPNIDEMKRKASLPASPNPTPVSRDALAGALTEFLVAPLPPAHALLLNKFPIVAKSAIIATTAFEPQELPLTLQDVWALWAVVASVRGLGYYNCGPFSGASQPRRHTQFIAFRDFWESLPESARTLLPLGTLPIDAAIAAAQEVHATSPGEPFTLPAYRTFPHAVCLLGGDGSASAEDVYAAYLSLLRVINADDSSRHSHAHARPASAPPSQAVPAHSGKSGAPSPDSEGAELAAATVALSPPAYPSHNVLLTPRWLAVFPRARSAWAGVAVNSVGFAGLLLTRADGVEALKSATPLGVLRACVLDLQPDI